MKNFQARTYRRFPTAVWLNVPACAVQPGDIVRFFDGPTVNVRRVAEVNVGDAAGPARVLIEGRLPVSNRLVCDIVPHDAVVAIR